MSVGRDELRWYLADGRLLEGRMVVQRRDDSGSVTGTAPVPRSGTGGAVGPPAAAIGLGEQRPALSGELSGAELRRWYWLRTELAGLARQLGVSTAGGKAELTERLALVLDGLPAPVPAPRRRSSSAGQLSGELTTATVIPAGQRCSQALRGFFTTRVGAGFVFDGAMRSFISDRTGSTLGDAVAHWYATRSAEANDIGGQFELNRFTRRWYLEHPGGYRADLLAAWAAYRATPVDHRSCI